MFLSVSLSTALPLLSADLPLLYILSILTHVCLSRPVASCISSMSGKSDESPTLSLPALVSPTLSPSCRSAKSPSRLLQSSKSPPSIVRPHHLPQPLVRLHRRTSTTTEPSLRKSTVTPTMQLHVERRMSVSLDALRMDVRDGIQVDPTLIGSPVDRKSSSVSNSSSASSPLSHFSLSNSISTSPPRATVLHPVCGPPTLLHDRVHSNRATIGRFLNDKHIVSLFCASSATQLLSALQEHLLTWQ